MRVLVVEDEPDLRELLARGLRLEGYAVDVAEDGAVALELVGVHTYDLVCLDLRLPRVDGLEVCSRIRAGECAEPESPPRMLMLTARDGAAERVLGLDLGADDYLVKPFDFDELAARLRALLRRDAGRSGSMLEVGDLRLDTARRTVRRAGLPLSLSPKEFSLLRYFMTNPGRPLSQEELLEHVWDVNADPFTGAVKVAVMSLRRKLATTTAPAPIETVVGAGYRLLDGTEEA
ncbi:MAG: response regulator transcription factor [Phycicoccus sp.]